MKTGHKRLLKLVDILRQVPRKQFDMSVWCTDDECGTVACAAGWACMDPDFRRAGLSFSKRNDSGPWRGFDRAPSLTLKDGTVVNDEWCALEQFFDLTNDEAEYLFMPHLGKPNTPKAVATRMEKFVRFYEE